MGQQGELVVTRNNQPFALMLDVGEDLEEILLLVSRLRAQRAVSAIRAEARERGLDKLTPDEIEAEVAAARAARRGVQC